MSNIRKNKSNLRICLCAFLNSNYIEEAKVCIESIRKNGKFNGRIDLITDKDVVIKGVNIIKVYDCKSVYESAGYRLRILEILNTNDNDLVLYLDTDIVILKPIPLFNDVLDKVCVYGYPSRTQKEHNFAGFITDNDYYIKKTAFCSGILLFRATYKIKHVLNETWKLYKELIKKGRINSAWEQPALCFKLIEYKLFDVCLNYLVYEEITHKQIPKSVVFNHFCEMRGDDRVNKMRKYL